LSGYRARRSKCLIQCKAASSGDDDGEEGDAGEGEEMNDDVDSLQCELFEVGQKASKRVKRTKRLLEQIEQLTASAQQAMDRDDEATARQALKDRAALRDAVAESKAKLQTLQALAAKLEAVIQDLTTPSNSNNSNPPSSSSSSSSLPSSSSSSSSSPSLPSSSSSFKSKYHRPTNYITDSDVNDAFRKLEMAERVERRKNLEMLFAQTPSFDKQAAEHSNTNITHSMREELERTVGKTRSSTESSSSASSSASTSTSKMTAEEEEEEEVPLWWRRTDAEALSDTRQEDDASSAAQAKEGLEIFKRHVTELSNKKMKASDVTREEIMFLRHICKTYGVDGSKVDALAGGVRISLYRFAVNLALEAANFGTKIKDPNEAEVEYTPPDLLCSIARDLGVEQEKAITITSAGVATRVRSLLLQMAVQLRTQQQADVEVTSLLNLLEQFPPLDDAAEIEMLIEGLTSMLTKQDCSRGIEIVGHIGIDTAVGQTVLMSLLKRIAEKVAL